MADVLMIYPRTGFDVGGAIAPPFSSMLASAKLHEENYKVKIIDARIEKYWKHKIDEEIKENPVCIGLTTMTGAQIKFALGIAKHIKEKTDVLFDSKNFLFSKVNIASKIKMREYISKIVKEGYQMPCYAGKLNCVITNTGKVYPCELLDKCMGDLRKESFMKIWNSSNPKEIRKFIKESKCYCTEECNVNMNLLFNLKHALKIMTNAIFL